MSLDQLAEFEVVVLCLMQISQIRGSGFLWVIVGGYCEWEKAKRLKALMSLVIMCSIL